MSVICPTATAAAVEVQEFLPELAAPLANIAQIASDFSKTYRELALSSSSQFLPTPITNSPDGKERGKFLALDLGGSNLRVGIVELFGDDDDDAKGRPVHQPRFLISPSSTWPVPDHLKAEKIESLFDWVAECIASVVRTYLSQCSHAAAEEISREGLPLGVTFSFPMIQTTHTSALLMPGGKGFTFSTTNDLATLLTNAYAKQQREGMELPKVKVTAITNDSISTLLAGGYLHMGNTTVGIVAGTGTNATCLYPVGKLGDFKKLPEVGEGMLTPTHVLVNTEWSINGTSPPIERYLTKWDKILDAGNEKPGFQPFEEMVGGRYLGELVRLISLDVLGTKGVRLSQPFYEPYSIPTKLCAEVEAVQQPEEIVDLLKNHFFADVLGGTWQWDIHSATTFKKICQAVSDRAAALVVAAAMGILDVNDDLGLYTQTEQDISNVFIAFTGTVLEKYPGFRERCQQFMDQTVEQWYQKHSPVGVNGQQGRAVRFVEAKEGGIIGATVLAAMVRSGRT